MARRLAVLIANNSYRHLPDLVAPVDEAEDLQAVLTHPEIGGFDRVELLRDESKTSVERALADALGAAGPDDLVVIYFSGHGQLSSRGRLYLAVHNSEPAQLPATAISASWLRELLEESAAASTVIMLDCCYSGAYVFANKAAPEVNLNQELKAGSGRYVLTATNAVEQAEDAGLTRDRSAFTEVVINGLSTGAADVSGLGVITPEDLGRYVRNELPKHTAWQTPTMHGSVQDDVFLARVPGTRYRADADNSTIRLAGLLGELTETGDVALCAVEWRGRGPLLIPIGRAFRPGMPPGEVMTLDLAGPAGNVILVGGSGSGKSTLLRTLITATALTHTPDEVAFYCLESGGNRLGSLRALRHIRRVAADDQPKEVEHILREVRECIARRKQMFRAHDIESAGRLRRLRGELPEGPHPDVFLVIDRWREFNEKFPSFAAQVQEIANSGVDYALHVVVSARRWADVPEDIVELAHSQIELRAGGAGQRSTQAGDRRVQLPRDRPGWAISNNRVFRIALPDISADPPPDESDDNSDHDDGARNLLLRMVQAWGWEAGLRGRQPSQTVLSGLVDSLDLFRILGVHGVTDIGGYARRPRSDRQRLRVPMGTGVDGDIVELDLKESAQEGMGPHGLIIGATGSGKSELLRSIVVALAITHSPDTLNFVLVDFKGGATFASLDALPHISATVTNLADDLPLVDRLVAVLTGELVRRQELLRASGNYASHVDYEKARATGLPLEPLPSLVIICDEFSQLLAAQPNFIDVFVQISRVGRSLGVHLLLASQRLEEGRLRGLDTYLSYRIGLRTFSAMESRIVLGAPDAYELPRAPGHGYLKIGSGELIRFRAAYVSGPLDPGALEGLRAGADGGEPSTNQGDVSPLDVVVAQLRDQGPTARLLWLPPLVEPPTFDQLLGPLVADPDRGLCAANWPGSGALQVPVGVVDRPFEQRRDRFVLDLNGSAGNVAIIGGPQSGKSTLLRSLLLSLALTHTPRETQLHCLDFGGALRGLDGLPHRSGMAGRRDAEAVRRIVAEVSALLDEREARFIHLGVDSIASYRRRRQRGDVTDDPYGDVFLVVDGWGVLRQEYEELEQAITNLATRGLGFGIHVVVTATRWADIRPSLRDLLGTRLELRLGDPTESEIGRRHAVNVPDRMPGRGLTPDKLHFLAAVPRIDGRASTENLAEATADAVARSAAYWPFAPAPKVRLLPRVLPMAELAKVVDLARPGLPIGIDEAHLAPVHLDFATEPHFVVFGDSESGKTNLLRLIARSVVERYTPQEARLVIADYRRGLLAVVNDDHLIGYAPSSTALTEVIGSVRTAMQERLPGPDVTQQQLRERTWWRGPDLYILVDDYDLVASAGVNPIGGLMELLSQARDIGMHLILARRVDGASRSRYEPVLQRLLERSTPGLLLSGNREEGVLLGNLRPSEQPAGRGTLVRRGDGNQLVQTAWVEPE